MLIDTSAWVEFFEDTEKAMKVQNILFNEECHTLITTLAEIANVAARKGKDISYQLEIVKKHSHLLEVDENISILAGKLNFERKKTNEKWGMLDSFLLATALIRNSRILTKDPDFKDLNNVEML